MNHLKIVIEFWPPLFNNANIKIGYVGSYFGSIHIMNCYYYLFMDHLIVVRSNDTIWWWLYFNYSKYCCIEGVSLLRL